MQCQGFSLAASPKIDFKAFYIEALAAGLDHKEYLKTPYVYIKHRIDAFKLKNYYLLRLQVDQWLGSVPDKDLIEAVNNTKKPLPIREEMKQAMLAFTTPHFIMEKQFTERISKTSELEISPIAAKGIVEAFNLKYFEGDYEWVWPALSKHWQRIKSIAGLEVN